MQSGRTWGRGIRALAVALVPVPVQPQQPGRGSAAEKNRAFVEHLYQDVLGRAADPGALAAYGSALTQGAMTRLQLAQAVLGSQEYATIVVTALYVHLLHRQPDPAGLAMQVGVLQHGGTAEQVEASLLASDEYYARP